MTKEEMLKQEAEEWLNKWELCNKCDHKVQCIEDNAMCPQVVERAYLASAEPREKQITGLSKHILELQKDKGNLIDRCRELEKRCANYEMTISKMEKGTCDICKEIEKDNRIVDLEEKISVLLSCKNCPENKGGYICAKEYENKCLAQKIEYIKELQEENAELRKDKKELCHSISEGGKACVYLNEQLTKAKEIIKNLLSAYISYADSFDDRDNEIVEKAEQFLNSEPQSKWINPARTTNDNEIKIK